MISTTRGSKRWPTFPTKRRGSTSRRNWRAASDHSTATTPTCRHCCARPATCRRSLRSFRRPNCAAGCTDQPHSAPSGAEWDASVLSFNPYSSGDLSYRDKTRLRRALRHRGLENRVRPPGAVSECSSYEVCITHKMGKGPRGPIHSREC